MKIYVASSWRNPYQPAVVQLLRDLGNEVYDFRQPPSTYSWSELDPMWESWNSRQYYSGLFHPIAEDAFDADYTALNWADATVLVLPAGRSAHLEAGFAVGQGKPACVYVPESHEPLDLMHKMADIVFNIGELEAWISETAERVVQSILDADAKLVSSESG